MEEEIRNEVTTEDIAQARTPPAIDPAMLARIATVLGAMQPSTPPKEEATPTTATASPLGGDGLSSLLSNPAMLEKLPQIMAMLKPMLDAKSSVPTSVPTQQSTAVAASQPHHFTDRDNLLLALKPFLSSERRDAVDSILRIAKLGELFKNMQ